MIFGARIVGKIQVGTRPRRDVLWILVRPNCLPVLEANRWVAWFSEAVQSKAVSDEIYREVHDFR